MDKQKKRGDFLVIILAFVLLLGTYFYVSDGFSGIQETITGRAIVDNTTASVTVASVAPVINNAAVEPPSAQTITEDSQINITFYFNVTDADGAADLNGSSILGSINKTGQTIRESLQTAPGCTFVSNINTTTNRYNCTVPLYYFDGDGTWTINISIEDNSSNAAVNLQKTFTVNPTTGMTMSPTAISWSSINLGDTNSLSGDDPIVINNTANTNQTQVNVTAYMLHGATEASEFINAGNFSGKISDACEGTIFLNATSLNITNAVVNPGNHTLDDGSQGQEQLYFCLEAIAGPGDLSIQTYQTLGGLPWQIIIGG